MNLSFRKKNKVPHESQVPVAGPSSSAAPYFYQQALNEPLLVASHYQHEQREPLNLVLFQNSEAQVQNWSHAVRSDFCRPEAQMEKDNLIPLILTPKKESFPPIIDATSLKIQQIEKKPALPSIKSLMEELYVRIGGSMKTRKLRNHQKKRKSYLLLDFDSIDEPKVYVKFPSYNHCVKFRKRMIHQKRHLQRSWLIGVQCLQTESQFAQDLLAFHLGFRIPDKSSLTRHLKKLAQVFWTFAQQQPEFNSLSKCDQRRLMYHNAPLFIQFVLGKYFTSSWGIEQCQWLFLGQIFQFWCPNITVASIGWIRFNQLINLFKDDRETKDQYHWEAQELNLPLEVLHHLAWACLFRRKDDDFMDNREALEDAEDRARIFLEFSNEVYGTPSLEEYDQTMSRLEFMTELFEVLISSEFTSGLCVNAMHREITLLMTKEEDHWKENQLGLFWDKFNSVNPIPALIDVCNGTSSLNFLELMLSIGAVRAKRLLLSFESVRVLSAEDARLLCANVSIKYLSTISSLGARKEGLDRLAAVVGTKFVEELQNVNQCLPVQHMSLERVLQFDGSMQDIPLETVKKFDEMCHSVSDLFTEESIVQLLTLVIITNPSNIPGRPLALRSLHEEFKNLFWHECMRKGHDQDQISEMVSQAYALIKMQEQMFGGRTFKQLSFSST